LKKIRVQPKELQTAPILQLDLDDEVLWRGAEAIALRPKVFAVLRCLAEHPGQLVTKAALCRAAWPDVVVGDGGLMVCIRELRRALGDDPKASRFIETLPRRGYRLVADVAVTRRGDTRARPSPRPRRSARGVPAFGRAAEIECLRGWLGHALDGERQIVFVTGEAGVGKTTLAEAFVEELQGRADLLVAHGRCIEPYGAGEAYLPFLEALGELCRGPHASDVVGLLAKRAPTWLVQMPWLVSPSQLGSLDRRVASATRSACCASRPRRSRR
jgi:DNA-binding winged helix-turn-helix (wHTH) protein